MSSAAVTAPRTAYAQAVAGSVTMSSIQAA